MKEPFPLEPGRVVESIQGRDKGSFFLILENRNDGYVLMADGRKHRLEAPKKKKYLHVKAKPVQLELNALRKEGGPLQNSDLRRALQENGFAENRSLCKEG